jgi:hypothetical protein
MPFVDLMCFEVNRARHFLLAGWPLVDALPGRLRMDIDLFVRGGLRTLERIEGIGHRVWQTRPVLTKLDIARVMFGSLMRRSR